MFRGAGYRSPTLTVCRNGLLAKNAKRRHGFCSKFICFSNMLSATRPARRLSNLRVSLALGYWNAHRHLLLGLVRTVCAVHQIRQNPISARFRNPCFSTILAYD
jgi:hypothetical protein